MSFAHRKLERFTLWKQYDIILSNGNEYPDSKKNKGEQKWNYWN